MQELDRRAWYARVSADHFLDELGVNNPRDYRPLAELLGHRWISSGHFADSMTDRDIEVCEMLAGPHGKTIYKILLARMQDADPT